MKTDNKYKQLADDAKEYAQLRYDMLRLEVLDKLSRILLLAMMALVTLVLTLAAFVYLSFGIVALLRPLLGDVWSFVIMGVFFLILLVGFFVFRKKILVNPLIAKLSVILFRDTTEPKNDQTPPEV